MINIYNISIIIEKDLQQYKSDNLNLKKELEDKEKLCVSIMKEKKQKS